MSAENIRERIINYIDRHRSASAPEMAEALDVTRANVRHHLVALQNAGVVEITPGVRPTTRGRPVHHYHLRSEARPNNFSSLIHALMRIYVSNKENNDEFHAALRRLAAFMLDDDLPQGNLTRRLSALVRLLNLWNYQARWEAHSQAPQVIFRNCPYAAILPKHPELCVLDRHLLEHATNQAAHQTARVDLVTNEPPACVFLLAAREVATSTP